MKYNIRLRAKLNEVVPGEGFELKVQSPDRAAAYAPSDLRNIGRGLNKRFSVLCCCAGKVRGIGKPVNVLEN